MEKKWAIASNTCEFFLNFTSGQFYLNPRQIALEGVRVFTHMVSCYHEEALNYKFKHEKADQSLSDGDRVAQWFTADPSGTYR